MTKTVFDLMGEAPLEESLDEVVQLRELLTKAYRNKDLIRALMDACGLDETAVNWDKAVKFIWREVFLEAHRTSRLQPLLEHARKDPSIDAFHKRLGELLDASVETPLSIRWLQLGSLDLGGEEDAAERLAALEKALEGARREGFGVPDLVLLGGNIVQNGQPEQFEAAVGFLDGLREMVGQVPVFAVPGPGDLLREGPAYKTLRWLKFYDDGDAADERAALWGEPKTNEELGALGCLFEPYTGFVDGHLLRGQLVDSVWGPVPGDLRASLNLSGFRLGLVGLSSAWRVYTEAGGARAVVEPRQLEWLMESVPGGVGGVVDRHHLTLLLQHHPPEALLNKEVWDKGIKPPFGVVLFGQTGGWGEAVVGGEQVQVRLWEGDPLQSLRWDSPRTLPALRVGTQVPQLSAAQQGDADTRAELWPWERQYLKLASDGWRAGSTHLIQSMERQGVPERTRVYVSLKGTFVHLHEMQHARRMWQAIEQDPDHRPEQLVDRLERSEGETPGKEAVALEAALSLNEAGCVRVEGVAGSGKTCLLEHIAELMARAHRSEPLPEGHALDTEALTSMTGELPVPVLLRADALASKLGDPPRVNLEGFVDAIVEELGRVCTGGLVERDQVEARLAQGRYMILVDALDEVQGVSARTEVVRCLETAAKREGWQLRIVLTTRPIEHTGVAATRHWHLLVVEPMDDETGDALMRKWAQAKGKGARYAEDMVERIRRACEKHQADFTRNPMLLTCAVIIYIGRQEKLPRDTAELYEAMVDLLCRSRTQGRLSEDERRTILQEVAFIIQSSQPDSGDQTLIQAPLDRIADELGQWVKERFERAEDRRELLRGLSERTGLLRIWAEEDGRERVRFWHRSFLQYLCARHLTLRRKHETLLDVTDRLFGERGGAPAMVDDPGWWAVLRFLPGAWAVRGTSDARDYLQRLHDHARGRAGGPGESLPAYGRPGRLYALMAHALEDYRHHFDGSPLLDDIPKDIVAGFPEWPIAERLMALDALGEMFDEETEKPGDPRLGLDALWVEVVGGGFVMGKDPGAWDRAPSVKRVGGGVKMAWRPVTVADFESFVEAGGYGDERWWIEGGFGAFHVPEHWPSQRQNKNHPVAGVCWYEAAAFCKWATEAWGVDEGWKVDLPMEAEWEWVARAGDEGRDFPWGNEAPQHGEDPHANFEGYRGLGAMRVSPVGAYARGNQGQFVDLGGNVWEWCRDRWRDTDDESWQDEDENCRVNDKSVDEDDKTRRVVRGGSWFYRPGRLRCASRDGNTPILRDNRLGFRVVCVPASTW